MQTTSTKKGQVNQITSIAWHEHPILLVQLNTMKMRKKFTQKWSWKEKQSAFK